MDLHHVIQRPIVTEKSAIAREEANIATFRVDPAASKGDIRQAVEQLFSVKVKAVNTLVRKGKRKVFRGIRGRQTDVKKAVVTLEDGHSIDVTTGL